MYLEKIVSLYGNWELKITSGQLGVMFFIENEKRKKNHWRLHGFVKLRANQCNLLQVLKKVVTQWVYPVHNVRKYYNNGYKYDRKSYDSYYTFTW